MVRRISTLVALCPLFLAPVIAQTASFTSTGALTIASSGNATPYPAAPLTSCANGACVNVTGLAGAVQNVTLTFNSWNNTGTEQSSTFIAVLLQAPNGTSYEVMSNACKAPGSSSFVMTDAATLHAAPNTTCFSTGNWKPTTIHFTPFVLDNFSSPGPGTTYTRADPDGAGNGTTTTTNAFANTFGGISSALGVWHLYITSAAGGGAAGSIASWTLTVTTAGAGNATTTTVTSDTPDPSFTTSSPVTLSATVSPNPGAGNGTVLFHSNGTAGGAGAGDLGTGTVNASGLATLSNVQFATEGAHQIIATYQGGTGFATSTSAPATHEVIKTSAPQGGAPVGTFGFCNTGGISLPTAGATQGIGPGNPYPSSIAVSGLSGLIQSMRVYINGYTSQVPELSGLLLAGPNGKTLEFESLTGGPTTVTSLNMLFDDAAGSQALPNSVSFASQSYKPTAAPAGIGDLPYCQTAVCNGITVSEPAPLTIERAGPQGNPARTLSSQFAGSGPNGTWQLFEQLIGQFSGGATQTINNWCVNFTLTTGTATTTSVISNPNPSTTGSAVSFDATVTNTASPGTPINTGTVAFVDSVTGNTLGTIAVASGHAVLSNITNLTEGFHTITASYGGTASFGFSSNTVVQRVNNLTVQNPANTTRWCNQTSGMTIPASGFVTGASSPFPSNVIIAAQPGTINAVRIDLNGYQMATPSVLNTLLVGPCQGVACSFDFFSRIPEGSSSGPFNLSFFDAAVSTVPNSAFGLPAGSYKPFSSQTGNIYPSPAPAGPYNYAAPAGAATFNSTNGLFQNLDANGQWSLYPALNAVEANAGSIQSWCVNLTINPPVLAVNKTHIGPGTGNAFIAGQSGSYTIGVTNNGPGSTAGAIVTIDDPLPSGLTQTNINGGTDWTCGTSTSTHVVCTTAVVKTPGQSFSSIVVTIAVAVTSPLTVTNTATASGFSMTSGSGVDGPTAIIRQPILSVSNTDNGTPLHTFKQSDTGKTATFTVSNGTALNGAGPTTSQVTVTFTVSSGLTTQSITPPGAGWSCNPVAASFTCQSTASPALAIAANAAFTLTFNVTSASSTPQTIQASVTGGGGNSPSNTDTLTIIPVATHFTVSATSPQTAGTPFNVTVTALDAGNNVVPVYTGTVHFTSTDGNAVLPVNYTFISGDSGVHTFSVTLKTAGTQTVTATDAVTSSITGTSGSINVGGTGPVITLNPANQSVNALQIATFTASATGNPTPTVQWQLSTDGGTNFNNIGGATSTTLSFTASGSQNGNKFRAVFTNTGGSTPTTAATLTVAKLTPAISWANPAGIPFGSALGSGQLNATASVPGAFVYTPAAGAVLPAGNGRALSVLFTPTDTANYNTASASVLINITPVGGPAQLLMTRQLARDTNTNEVLVTLTFANTGSAAFTNLVLNTVKAGTTNPASPSLPATVAASIPGGGAAIITFRFPVSLTGTTLTVAGVYDQGTISSGSRITIPPPLN